MYFAEYKWSFVRTVLLWFSTVLEAKLISYYNKVINIKARWLHTKSDCPTSVPWGKAFYLANFSFNVQNMLG